MKPFRITVKNKSQSLNFDVMEYLHHEEGKCKFEVYCDGEIVASFEPDKFKFLQVCKNPGRLRTTVLNSIANQLETMMMD